MISTDGLPADLRTQARRVIDALFTKYEIGDPRNAHELIRQRFSQADLDAYHEALTTLYEQGVLG